MKHFNNTLFFALLVMVSPLAVGADSTSWSVDRAHSRVGFSVKHFGINTVHGVFSKYDAEVKADASGKLSAVNATVYVKSINTQNETRDEHLREPELFNVAKFPTIEMKTKSIKWNGNKMSGIAALTIKGKTRSVKFKGARTGTKSVTEKGKKVLRAGYKVSARIDRNQFGIVFGGMTEGLGMVGETVTISLNIETTRPL
jgi:polyisoprenoid-binding protein YceI